MRRRAAALIVLLLTLGVAWVAPAEAVGGNTSIGSFEIDGNLTDDTGAGEPIDWANLTASGGTLFKGFDKPSGTTDDSYAGADSKDDSLTPNVGTGAIPNNKSDLLRFYVGQRHVGPLATGAEILTLAWVRAKTLGTSNFSFELNRQRQPAPPVSGPWAKVRTPGDVLIRFDFASGGNAITIGVSRWVVSGKPKTVCQANPTVPCWGKVQTLAANAAAATVNDPAAPGFDATFPMSDPLSEPPGADLAVATFGEAAINLNAANILLDPCAGFSSAEVRSRSSNSFNADLKDFIAPIAVSIRPPSDPTDAHANGTAIGAKVDDPSVLGGANPLILPDSDPNTPGTQVVTSSQTGPGQSTDDGQLVTADVPDADQAPPGPKKGDVAHADVLRATSTSTVSALEGANQSSAAETLGVTLFKDAVGTPLVSASAVRGVANTTATGGSSGFSSAGSWFKDLVVDPDRSGPNGPLAMNNVSPNTRVILPAAAFGSGSYVALYELGPGVHPTTKLGVGTTSQPGVGQFGTYAADLTVTMIRVKLTDQNPAVPGDQPAEVWVSRAQAHSDFEGLNCAGHEVSGHAFVLSENTTPSVVPVVVGFVGIPRSGGHQEQHLDSLSAPVATGQAADSLSDGLIQPTANNTPGFAKADSFAQVVNACILPTATGCTISATVLKAASHSRASGTSASAHDGSATPNDATDDTTVVASVNGGPLLAQPPNTTVPLDGLGFVTFNEQFCDGAGVLADGCGVSTTSQGKTTRSAGLTVQAIHVVITVPDNPLGLAAGVEIIVAEAHSDASFVN